MIQRPLQMSFYILILCVTGCVNDTSHAPNNAPLELNQDSETTGNLDGGLETRGEADARAPGLLEDECSQTRTRVCDESG